MEMWSVVFFLLQPAALDIGNPFVTLLGAKKKDTGEKDSPIYSRVFPEGTCPAAGGRGSLGASGLCGGDYGSRQAA